MGTPKTKKPLARSLGEFVGILVKAAKTDVRPPSQTATTPPSASATVVRETVEERVVHTPQGPVTLRRRVVDEVLPGTD